MPEETTIDGRAAKRRHIVLFEDDYEFIQQHFGETIGTSAAIRLLLSRAINQIKAKAYAKAQAKAISSDEGLLDESKSDLL